MPRVLGDAVGVVELEARASAAASSARAECPRSRAPSSAAARLRPPRPVGNARGARAYAAERPPRRHEPEEQPIAQPQPRWASGPRRSAGGTRDTRGPSSRYQPGNQRGYALPPTASRRAPTPRRRASHSRELGSARCTWSNGTCSSTWEQSAASKERSSSGGLRDRAVEVRRHAGPCRASSPYAGTAQPVGDDAGARPDLEGAPRRRAPAPRPPGASRSTRAPWCCTPAPVALRRPPEAGRGASRRQAGVARPAFRRPPVSTTSNPAGSRVLVMPKSSWCIGLAMFTTKDCSPSALPSGPGRAAAPARGRAAVGQVLEHVHRHDRVETPAPPSPTARRWSLGRRARGGPRGSG